MVPKHTDLYKIIKDGSKLEMDALRRSSTISRKERIRNVTIRQQTGLEKTIIKKIEQNQLTWYGHFQRMAEGRLPKIVLQWMPKQKRA
jgi:predicted metal-dependent phosphotriesterase family hydrolase